jgi:hypothetical protein
LYPTGWRTVESWTCCQIGCRYATQIGLTSTSAAKRAAARYRRRRDHGSCHTRQSPRCGWVPGRMSMWTWGVRVPEPRSVDARSGAAAPRLLPVD